jgi:hypothetical protein
MGRTSGFVIEWPVTFDVEDGRRFEVALSGDDAGRWALHMRVVGRDAWRLIGESYGEATTGAVIGRALRWWYEATGDPIILAPTAHEDSPGQSNGAGAGARSAFGSSHCVERTPIDES